MNRGTPGHRFDVKAYWLHGEGLAKWATWTELHNHLRKHVPDEQAKRIAAQWYHDRYGRWPGAHHGDAKTAAAVNGHHVPGTSYNWRHGYEPLNVATALQYGKKKHADRLRSEAGKRDLTLRRLSDDDLDRHMQDALEREDYARFDKLSAEADRREANAPAREAARLKREQHANDQLDEMSRLIDEGMSEADAHAQVYGGNRQDFHRKQAVDMLRQQGYTGRSFDDLSRQSFNDHGDAEYDRAEADTRGVMLSREAEAFNARQGVSGRKIDPRALFSTNEATARKHASKELRDWWDANGRPTLAEWRASLLDDPQQARNLRARRNAMAAAASTDEGDHVTAPPAAWFADPELDTPTALTVTEDGQVYGHLAAWGVRHLGLADHTEAPSSRSGYRYFRNGAVLTADGGQVAVGHITLGTGHAALEAGVTAAAEHYDDTGAAVADVVVGEDEHGIWVAGAVRPGTTSEQVHALRASPLSGDWRSIDGDLELVAALAVNVPGFPVPRSVAASGVAMTLVAAGALVAAPTQAPAKPPAKPGAKPAAKPAVKPGAKTPAKPPAKKPPAKKPAEQKPPAQSSSSGDFNSKHPRAPAGAAGGGQFAPLGAARSSDAAKAQQDPKAHAAYDALLKGDPGARAGMLKGMKDADLEALSRTAYSFKSSDPKVVAARIAIANELAKRGKDVKNFGALGGGPARKAAPAKAAPKAAPKPPAKPAPKPKARTASAAGSSTPTIGRDPSMPVTFTDDEIVVLRHSLGVGDDADSAVITAALVEALDERAEDAPADEHADAAAADEDEEVTDGVHLPDGLVAIDSTILDELRQAAARGEEARTQQERESRELLVASAVKDGRVAPARRDHWIKQLEADPGASVVLASLAPGLVPVGSEVGVANGEGDPDADALYASVFGKDA